MNVQIDTVLEMYDQEIARLSKENLMLKAQLKQIAIDKQKEEETKAVE